MLRVGGLPLALRILGICILLGTLFLLVWAIVLALWDEWEDHNL